MKRRAVLIGLFSILALAFSTVMAVGQVENIPPEEERWVEENLQTPKGVLKGMVDRLSLTQEQKDAVMKFGVKKLELWFKAAEVSFKLRTIERKDAADNEILETLTVFRQNQERYMKQIKKLEETVLKMNLRPRVQLQLTVTGVLDNGWPLPFLDEEEKLPDYISEMVKQLIDLFEKHIMGNLPNLTQEQEDAVLKLGVMKLNLWDKVSELIILNNDKNASDNKILEALTAFRQNQETAKEQIKKLEETVLKMNLAPKAQLQLILLGVLDHDIGVPFFPVLILFPPK